MFIERIRRNTEYCFMVTNHEGIIIAATEKERVGVFHEASYLMIRDGMDMITVLPHEVNDYLGVKPGVDMPIVHDGETVGALGITGAPEEVKPIISTVKLAIEAMLEYEELRERVARTNSEQETFFNLLLSNKAAKSDRLISLAQHLNYRIDIVRIAIVFEIEGVTGSVLSRVTKTEGFGHQDFAFTHKGSELVLFHRLSSKSPLLFAAYRQFVNDFLEPIFKLLDHYGIQHTYAVGSIQNKLSNYRFAYRQCRWLLDNHHYGAFFYDHATDYLKEQIPMLELNGIYQAVLPLLDEEMIENYQNTVSVLAHNNYNLVASSKELYLHKNTLVFRLNKIRDFLHLDPIKNASDREFMNYLNYYLSVRPQKPCDTDHEG
jgi:carbohydrate diacid regulator